MKKYSGKGVYGAIAIGKISVLKKNDAAVTRVHVEDAAAEKARVEKAKQAAAEQLQAIHDKALKEVGEANAQIFEIHIMMLEDEDYNESIGEHHRHPAGQRGIRRSRDLRQFRRDVRRNGRRVHAGAFSRCPGYLQPHNR